MVEKINKVGVVGAGLMGHGIAQLAAQAGCEVILVDVSEDDLNRGMGKIKKIWNKAVEKGKLPAEMAEKLLSNLKTSLDLNDLKDCDAVIEAIPEIMSLKKELFARLDNIVKPEAILASNTSQLSITEIASATNRPQQVVGMHFFYPAQIMRLIEIPAGEHTDDKCVQAIVDLSQRMGKETCVCRDTPGFIVNRLLAGLLAEASRVYDEKLASVEEIDKAIRLGLGHPMGPFQLYDFSGIDTITRAAEGLRAAYGDRFCLGTGVRNKFLAGDFGQKTGRGFYDYTKK